MLARLFVLLMLPALLLGCTVKIGLPDTPGAFIEAVQGDTFEAVDTLDPRNAMVYIYRPSTRWGFEEVQSPTLFIDGLQLSGLKSGAWTWLELHGGGYELYARRPMSLLFLKTIFELPLEVEGGKTYYFRYSEVNPVVIEEIAENPEQYRSAGPLQQVPEAFAKRELKHLRLDQAGLYYGGTAYKEPRWAPFYTYEQKLPSDAQASR